MSAETEKTRGFGIRTLLLLGGISVLLCIVFGLSVSILIDDWNKRGQFGDMFGALNAFFSALALAGVIYAILLQRQDLKLQREELKLQREELKLSREELRLSRAELTEQSKMISAQLSTMQDSLQFEQERESKTSEPFFKRIKEIRMANMIQMQMENHGATVTGVTGKVIEPAEGISFTSEPADVFPRGAQGEWKVYGFGGGPCPPVIVELSYRDRLGTKRTKKYRIEKLGVKEIS